jgi:hypothetical protein
VSGQRTLLRVHVAAGAAVALLVLGAEPSLAAPAGWMPRDGAARSVSLQGSTTAGSLRAAVARIPGYRLHRPARWVVSTQYPRWGITNWNRNTVYISPSVPSYYLDSVVRHEWSHILQARDYHLNIPLAVRQLNRAFGGPGKSGIRGAEYAADCMAIQLGATWTYYTSCRRPAWRHAATLLLHGRELR